MGFYEKVLELVGFKFIRDFLTLPLLDSSKKITVLLTSQVYTSISIFPLGISRNSTM